jgi:pimeloyl-ACP methyl ester carboxylesterase
VPTSTVPATTTVDEPPSTTATPRPSGTRDELVRVGGGQLHIYCSGSGPSTVVLIAGWNDDRTSFGTIEPALAASTRVCSYDKFGTGSSDPAPRAQRFTTQANDLHELLRLTNESGPYIVVGHSFGGDVAVAFASKFRDEVHGLLLLDATPTTWNTVLCSIADDGTAAASALVQLCAAQATAGDNAEGLDGAAAFAEIADISSLGDLPTIVDTAADRHYAEQGLSAELVARLTEAWDEGQQHWVALSSHSAFVEVPDTGHYIQRDQPDLVVDVEAEHRDVGAVFHALV